MMYVYAMYTYVQLPTNRIEHTEKTGRLHEL